MEVNSIDKGKLIAKLRNELLQWQGVKPAEAFFQRIGLPIIESAFPNAVFPKAAIHEFLGTERKLAAASKAFIAGLVSHLSQKTGVCVFISTSRTLFPPSLVSFGIEPDKVAFIDVKREKDALWAIEEALKCEGLAAVIAELREISFAQSRRLQLIIEKSKVTCFIVRTDERKINTTMCAARWKITPLPSATNTDMPGVGFPRWNVDLLKVKNGNPRSWKLEWREGEFKVVDDHAEETLMQEERKIG